MINSLLLLFIDSELLAEHQGWTPESDAVIESDAVTCDCTALLIYCNSGSDVETWKAEY